jgi:hypothetical protein
MTVNNRTSLSTKREYRLSSDTLFEVVTMGPASVHGTLSWTAQCNDVQCCSHGMFIIVVSNDDLGQKLNPNRLSCAKVLGCYDFDTERVSTVK